MEIFWKRRHEYIPICEEQQANETKRKCFSKNLSKQTPRVCKHPWTNCRPTLRARDESNEHGNHRNYGSCHDNPDTILMTGGQMIKKKKKKKWVVQSFLDAERIRMRLEYDTYVTARVQTMIGLHI